MARTIDDLLAEARSRISRLDPLAAAKAVEAGAALIDIRPEFQRRADGEIPGAFVIDRNVDVHVATLRKKLKSYGANILTIRGLGYKFRETALTQDGLCSSTPSPGASSPRWRGWSSHCSWPLRSSVS